MDRLRIADLEQLPGLLEKRNGSNGTPASIAYLAAQNGHVEVLKLLHEWSIRLDIPEKNGITPAHTAFNNGQIKVLRLFHKLGISLETPASDGATPAFTAARIGSN